MAINSSGDITLEGTLTAENYVVSSSVTNQTIAGVSGSTIFGDDLDDAHQITGSLSITGSGEVFIIPSRVSSIYENDLVCEPSPKIVISLLLIA